MRVADLSSINKCGKQKCICKHADKASHVRELHLCEIQDARVLGLYFAYEV